MSGTQSRTTRKAKKAAAAPRAAVETLGSGVVPSAESAATAETPRPGIPTPALALLPYQRRWIEDDSPFKIVVKARQIGYSFAATLRAALRCLERKTTWIFLSKGERQSRLLMEKVQEHVQSFGVAVTSSETSFFEGTSLKQLEVRFPNGSVIYGLPANPDTARGYTGHVTLDEFAFHADADKIYSALYPSITRGYGLEVISTPNGQQGKFFELARAAGLVNAEFRSQKSEWRSEKLEGAAPSSGSGHMAPDFSFTNRQSPIENRQSAIANHQSQIAPSPQPLASSPWSAHWCDIYEAARQGLKVDIELLRAGCEDEAAWQQEFCCEFVSTAENFFPPELLAACLSAEASVDSLPLLLASANGVSLGARDSGLEARAFGSSSPKPLASSPEFYLGIDIGRRHDRTVFWVDEIQKSEVRNQKSDASSQNLQGATHSSGSWLLTPDSSAANHQSPIGNFSIARLVRTLDRAPFAEQYQFARELMSIKGGSGRPLVRRACIDATGMGAPLAESLEREFGQRVEPVVFTAAVKEDLAYRTKRRLENRLSLIPDSREIRRAFGSVKKFVTPSGNIRLDAARTDSGHADEFWAKALADLAAETQPAGRASDGFLAPGTRLIDPKAFLRASVNWADEIGVGAGF